MISIIEQFVLSPWQSPNICAPFQILIIHQILDFAVSNVYYTSPGTDARDGFGRQLNQYPMDRNLTFKPFMSQGQ